MVRRFARPHNKHSFGGSAGQGSARVFGDVKPVGDGVFEMREFFGPGWRMYYLQRGGVLIVMLGGGEKSSQSKDISSAKKLTGSLDFKDFSGENHD